MTITTHDLIKALMEIPGDTAVQVVECYPMPKDDGSVDIEFVNLKLEEHFWYVPGTKTLQLGEIL